MDRRRFLLGLGSTGLAGSGLLAASEASAAIRCTTPNPADPQGRHYCEAGIQSQFANMMASNVGPQQQSQWCWAACIGMIFQYYGHPLPQSYIVRRVFGQQINMPANAQHIWTALNANWRDANGVNFRSRCQAFDALRPQSIQLANPAAAARDLKDNHPLIIGTLGHAMVLTSLVYLRDKHSNGKVTRAVVRDPWPGRGRRQLSAREWYATQFLARIRVSN